MQLHNYQERYLVSCVFGYLKEHEGEGGAEEQEPGPSHGQSVIGGDVPIYKQFTEPLPESEGGDRTPPRLVIDDESEGDEVVEQEGRDEGGWLPEEGE
ncbi:unnamed protein product, partial [Strongylus vulgaris]